MAEILLSLTIIGVVAAITLPSLTGNINERTWNTQRKALYARMSQAVALMPAMNGYGVLEEGDPNNVAEVFITNGLSKVLKINNICDGGHLPDCGIPSKIVPATGTPFEVADIVDLTSYNYMFDGSFSGNDGTHDWSASYHQINTKAAAFETANGESILTYYYPHCEGPSQEDSYMSQPKMCANFVYDLNGKKGPNTVGKDIGFMSVLYPSDSVVVAPVAYLRQTSCCYSQNVSISRCKALESGEYRTPNLEESCSMFYNAKALTGENVLERGWWTSHVLAGAEKGRYIRGADGKVVSYPRSAGGTVWCVKR